jgi:5-methyltetrahydrofolate--homocysteine methyltransferase
MSDFLNLQRALVAGDGNTLARETQKLLDRGIDPHAIIKKGLVPGMDVVGEKFKNDELYLPEVINIATIFKSSVNLIKPKLMDNRLAYAGKVVIGTVQGDMHDVGKNIVVLMLEANGFEVIDLGVDVPIQTFIKTAAETDADVVGMSALLTTTMPRIKEVISNLKAAELKNKFKTIIGGAPINQSFADQVGADAYGHDAIDAVEKIRKLVGKNP